jgi:fatty-acid peroxygenase
VGLSQLRSDLAWRLFRDGYRALPDERRRRGGVDTFDARMLGRRAVVVRGEEGARLFYDGDVVARAGAVPPPLAWLLFGRGAVHGMDGSAHRTRKAMFLDLLTPERVDPLVAAVRKRLEERMPGWHGSTTVSDELVEVYGGAVLSWAGIRLDDAEATRISHRLAEIVGGFGFAGTAYLRAWRSRLLLERWARRLVRGTRDGTILIPRETPLATIASHDELDDRTAAVELLNVLRPTVAVTWPATMAIADLLRRPDREEIVTTDRLAAYVHECRRLQPFVPALAGRARRPTRLGGVEIRAGDQIVLDVVGTHTDPRTWSADGDTSEVTDFDPGHFADGDPSPYAFVPQGGGHPSTGHRCPGEPLTVRLLQTTLRAVVEHSLRSLSSGHLDVSRIPARPAPPLRVSRPQT